MYLEETELCVHNLLTILGSISNISGMGGPICSSTKNVENIPFANG